MGKHDLKAEELQVDIIDNRDDNISAIEIRKGLRGSQYFDNSDPLAFLQRQDLDNLFVQVTKTRLVVPGGDFSIDWQAESPPGEVNTYAQKHGNSIAAISGYFIDGAVKRKYEVGMSFTDDVNGNILIVSFTDVFAGLLIII